MAVEIHQIEEKLTKLPSQIRDAQFEVIKARDVVEKAKLSLNLALSKEMLKSTEGNAQERKAHATINSKKEQEELIEAEIEYDNKEAERDYLKNRFDSIKKIANMETEAMRLNISGN